MFEEVGIARVIQACGEGLRQSELLIELAEGQRLVLIGCMTEFGRISVGLVMNAPLDPVWTTVIRKALQDVALRGRITR